MPPYSSVMRREHYGPRGPHSTEAGGSTLWMERSGDERIATIGISINYLRTAREGDVICETVLDRRNDRVAVLHSEVRHADGRLLATAIGSFSIFPKRRLAGRERSQGAGPGV